MSRRARQRVIAAGHKLATATASWLEAIERVIAAQPAAAADEAYAAAIQRFADELPDDPDAENPFEDVGRVDLEDVTASVTSVLEDAAKALRDFRKQLDELAAE